MKSALIVVDFQNDFGNQKHGSLYVPGGEQIKPVITELCALPFSEIVWTRELHPKNHKCFTTGTPDVWPPHCVNGTFGSDFMMPPIPTQSAVVATKGDDPDTHPYSGAGALLDKDTSKTAMAYLKEQKVTHIFICGLAYEFCVGATALDVIKDGCQNVYVILDATRGLFPDKIGVCSAQLVEAGGFFIWSAMVPEILKAS